MFGKAIFGNNLESLETHGCFGTFTGSHGVPLFDVLDHITWCNDCGKKKLAATTKLNLNDFTRLAVSKFFHPFGRTTMVCTTKLLVGVVQYSSIRQSVIISPS